MLRAFLDNLLSGSILRVRSGRHYAARCQDQINPHPSIKSGVKDVMRPLLRHGSTALETEMPRMSPASKKVVQIKPKDSSSGLIRRSQPMSNPRFTLFALAGRRP